MKRLVLCIFLTLIAFASSYSQINKHGYNQFKWGQSYVNTKDFQNCNTKLSGQEFINCDVYSLDSLFLKKYKFQFCNFRFYKNELSEIQFDLKHADIASVISNLTKAFGSPQIKEKKHQSLDKENHSTGYKWIIGDTQVLIINDGENVPAICVLSSISIQSKYPANTLNLEKLIFE